MNQIKTKLLVVLGPTASGKSDLAVQLAKELNGEIISADSRQVYKGLDIGTGKITQGEMQGIPHHLLDVADPIERFTVGTWKKMAEKCIEEISRRGTLPIICGGTGFYISALVDDLEFPTIENDPEKQKELESKTAEQLFQELKRVDPDRALSIDPKNKRRLARAIMIAQQLGKVPKLSTKKGSKYDVQFIGISIPDTELKKRIYGRLVKRIENGMIEEAQKLHSDGLSFERMNELGLEYRYLAEYLQNKINKEELISILSTKIWQYARRQKTWFKRDERIRWFQLTEPTQIIKTLKVKYFS